jgi:hypothetical protein
MVAPSPSQHCNPLVNERASLLDMLRYNGNVLIAVCQFFFDNCGRREELRASGNWADMKDHFIATKDLQQTLDAVSAVMGILQVVGCPQTYKSLKRFSDAAASDMTLDEFFRTFDDAYSRFQDEMEDAYTFHPTASVAQYWGRNDLLTEAARERFASVAQELRMAGSAYCAGLATASVFHSMRAAEVGLRVVADDLNIDVPNIAGMKDVIKAIRSRANALDEEQRSPIKSAKSQHYSEIAIEAGLFKDAWRNHVAHARVTYQQEQALEILNATRRFFEKVVSDYGRVSA